MDVFRMTFPMLGNLHNYDYQLTPEGIIQFVQDSVSRLLISKNLGAFDVREDGLGWVIFDYDIAIDPELPYWPNSVSIEMWVSEASAVRTFFDYRLMDSNGREFSKGTTCWTIIDAKERRAYLHAEEYIAGRFKVIPEFVFGKHKKLTMPACGELICEHSHSACSTDIDFNGHVSNRIYLSTALCSESVDFLRSHAPVAMKIKYLHETLPGDTLRCSVFSAEGDDATHIYILKNTADVEVCRIMLSWVPQEVNPARVRDFIVR